MPQITPCLWFDTEAEDAAKFYTSIFKNSRIIDVTRYGKDMPQPEGSVMTASFELDGQEFLGLNGGPQFRFSEAVSFQVHCETQEEADDFWDKLTDGGEESMCGWLKDRFGLSWQIIPKGVTELLSDPDRQRAERATKAMLQMRRLDLEAMRRAAEGG
ncbi:MAG: VOC family protein [Actinomycetes bacterium]